MRILVCFKVVRELDTVLPDDWAEAKNASFEVDYTRRIINCFDESALETALHVADESNGGSAEAVTITNDGVDAFLKNLYAVGYVHVSKIEGPPVSDYLPGRVAALLASFTREYGEYDAVFMGCQASVGDHAMTPYFVAEQLGWPCLNMVTDVTYEDGGLRVHTSVEGGQRSALVRQPAVYAFTNARRSYLRMATLREKMMAKKKEIDILDAAVLDAPLPRENRLLGLCRPQVTGRRGFVPTGVDAKEKTRILYEQIKEVLK